MKADIVAESQILTLESQTGVKFPCRHWIETDSGWYSIKPDQEVLKRRLAYLQRIAAKQTVNSTQHIVRNFKK